MREPEHSELLFQGRYVRVFEETWPGIGSWEVIWRVDAAAALPVTPEGDVLLVRQFRAAARKETLEVPAGLLDVPGEEPEACVARELLEETGFRHTSLIALGGMYPSPGSWTEYVHLFLARTAAAPDQEPEDGIELVRRPLDEMAAEARAGKVEDAKTALALLLAASRMPSG
ncbi:MAG: NUDIX hydrolase [Actinomycetota bacterium]